MKEASYYKKLDKNIVQCELCPQSCTLKPGELGFCRVRQNKDGKLYSLNYAKVVAANLDPIEKKPLFHFLPGSPVLSIATVGCNLACKHCQNWHESRAKVEEYPYQEISPEKIVDIAMEQNCNAIAYTYTEPAIFYEYMLDCTKLAKEKEIKNIIVSNGYINKKPLLELCKYIDGANIDLKAFTNDFYKKICSGRLEPVLGSLKLLKKQGIWFEITNLIIPTLNDNLQEIEEMCKWIKDNLGKDVPLHFSRFHPCYKLTNQPPTPEKTLKKAKKIADKYLNYVYVGNVISDTLENTYCPKCKELIVQRLGFQILKNKIKDSKCSKCGHAIPGLWE